MPLVLLVLAAVLVGCQPVNGASGAFGGTSVVTIPLPPERDHVILDIDVHLVSGGANLLLINPSGAPVPLAQLVGPRDIRTTSEARGSQGLWTIRWETTNAHGTYSLAWRS